jgi:hypothetical protein
MRLTLSAIVQGESGAGKSWLGTTTPAPRLILDVEGRMKYAPTIRESALWDVRGAIPEVPPSGTVLVKARSFDEMRVVYQWLASGQHPFKSLVVDSLSELQKRAMDSIVGDAQAQTQDWGTLLRKMETLVRQVRDLADHPTNPLDAVVLITGAMEKAGSIRPLLQGQLGTTVPFYVDLNGYLSVAADPQDPTKSARALTIQPRPGLVVKDGTDILTQFYGPVIYHPNFTEMLNVLNTPLDQLLPSGVANA